MNATQLQMAPSKAIPPKTLLPVKRTVTYARETWYFGPEAATYDDAALLTHCGYTPEFGGTVERTPSNVVVTVYTD